MSTIKGLSIKTPITWTEVKKEFNYPEDDFNEGFEYGFEFHEHEDSLDAQWFKTESDMHTFINQNELKIQVEVV